MKIAKQITDLIGHTPLVELSKFSKLHGAETPIIAKVEYFNPGGSIKDRVAFSMIEDAERKAWCYYHRTYKWQHRCWRSSRCCCKRL